MTCTRESPCGVCKDWVPEEWAALDKAIKLKQKRKTAVAKRAHSSWMIPLNCTHPRTEFRPHPSRERMTGRPGKRTTLQERTKQPPRPSDPMRNPARLCHLVCRWWYDPLGPTAHPGLGGLITIVGRVMIEVTTIINGDHPDVMSRPGPSLLDVTRPGAMRVGSGPDHHLHWEGPAPGPGMVLIQRTIRDQHVSRLRSSHHHSLRATVDHRSLPSHSSRAAVNHRSRPTQHHSRRHDGDLADHLRSSHVSSKEIDLTSTVPDQPERRTITVIQSPPHPATVDDSAGSTGPAEVADSARGDGPARPEDSAVVADPPVGDDLALVANSAVVDVPARTANSTRVADTAAVTLAGSHTPAEQA